MPRLGSWVRIPSPAPEKTARNQHQGCSSADEVPAPISLNEPRTVPNCLASLGKRRAKRSRKVRSPSSARASAPSSLIGAVGTHAASDIARAESKRPPGRPFDVFRLAKRRKNKLRTPSTLIEPENQRRVRAGRAGNAFVCSNCGAVLTPNRASRRQRYCSYTCRDEARRARNFAVSATTRRGSSAIPRSAENRHLVSASCRDGLAGRTPSIIGPQSVIETEIIAGLIWQSVVSPDGVWCEVARVRRGGR